MASATSSRKEPTQGSKNKRQASKLNGSVASSARSSPAPNSAGADPKNSQSQANGEAPEIETQQCKHCKKYVPKEGFSNHSKQCLRDKKERKRQKEAAEAAAAQAALDANKDGKDAEGDLAMDDSLIGDVAPAEKDTADNNNTPSTGTALKNARKSSSAVDTPAVSKNSKKRKADETPPAAAAAAATGEASASKPPNKKQKKKDESKPKATKPKGPVDVEKQCGVPLPNGAMCARSLTCKSHSMGAKRAVPGRSLPYDTLLHQYQKKNQARQQKAAIASTAALLDDSSQPTGPIDSDEEREAVMAGIARAAPRPLYEKPVISARQKYTHVRLKEMLSNALGGNRGSGLFATAPRSAAPVDESPSSATVNGVGSGNDWEMSGARSGSVVQV